MENQIKQITFSIEDINRMVLRRANEMGFYIPNGNGLNFLIDIKPITIDVLER